MLDPITEVLVVIRGGMVENVYASNNNVIVNIADMDTLDDERIAEAEEQVSEAMRRDFYIAY